MKAVMRQAALWSFMCYAIEPMERGRALTQPSHDRLNCAESCHIVSIAAIHAARGTNHHSDRVPV
jgi:hypothetical protein